MSSIQPPPIAVITGPTATGKTALGIALAKLTGGEIVSADSMQIYRDMDIGTAKPTMDERGGVPHHMVDVVSPFESYSAARYVEDASACVDDILARNKLPIIVGGTGLYIDALVRGLTFADIGDETVRRALEAQYDRDGGAALFEKLRKADPESAARLHQNDRKRVVRALEILETTGETITAHDARTRQTPPRYTARTIALTFADRTDLYTRIDRRVDQMMADGLQGEVRRLLDMGLTARHTAMQAIGYKEIAAALAAGGDLTDAAETIKMESRRYAKRQLSWLRRDAAIQWIVWNKEPDFIEGLQISTQYLGNNG